MTIPDGVTSIEEEAFSACDNLTSVNIPVSVTRISAYAFGFCSNLTSIHYAGTQAQWNAISKKTYWNESLYGYTVYFSDGSETYPKPADDSILTFTPDTNLIPTSGEHRPVNLQTSLYSSGSGTDSWEGARLTMTEEPATDGNGNPVTNVQLSILYEEYCARKNISPLSAEQSQFIVLKIIVTGNFEDIYLNTIAYESSSPWDVSFETGSMFGSIDPDLEGEVQYLVYDIEGIFSYTCDHLSSFQLKMIGMDSGTEVYLLGMGFFENEEDIRDYGWYY